MLLSALPFRRRASLGVLLALVCIVAQLGAALHLGLVRHVRCAAHGELMHADAGHDHADPTTALDVSTTRAVVFDAGAAPEHEHDHCQALASRSVEPTAPAVLVAAPPVTVDPPAPVARPLVVVVALYRLAPKASPPVA